MYLTPKDIIIALLIQHISVRINRRYCNDSKLISLSFEENFMQSTKFCKNQNLYPQIIQKIIL